MGMCLCREFAWWGGWTPPMDGWRSWTVQGSTPQCVKMAGTITRTPRLSVESWDTGEISLMFLCSYLVGSG